MKIMVVGGGGREHALIQKIAENPQVSRIYALPGNGGIAAQAECVPIGPKDIDAICQFAAKEGIDFAVVAQDDPLVLGAVDALNAIGIPCFGPDKKAAAIEGSKVFAKELMRKYHIPTAAYQVCDSIDEARDYLSQAAYPLATNPDMTAKDNAVNQFVAYHLLPMRLTWDKLVIHYIEMGYAYNIPSRLSINCFHYYETMGPYRRLLKITEGATTEGKRINRHSEYDTDTYDEIFVDRPGININFSNGENVNNALNGFYYTIDDILVYDDGVPGVVLNERLRWDFNELFAEMATNGYRRPADNTWIPFPRGYLANLEVSEESRIVYLPYFNTASQSNYQADEINVRGQYDLTFLLPPVPNEGTYELRICAPSNTGFGMAQIYFGTDKLNLQPVGLPIDLRIPPTNPNIGWEQDTEDIEHNNENDKIMRNHGYMKPPRHDGIWNGGAAVTESMRNTTSYAANLRMRKILWTGNVEPTKKYYVRVKSLLNNPNACFLLEYMEWCPKHIYNGPEPEDQW